TIDPKMFDAAVVRAELAHLATMLRALCAGTTSTLGEIGMLAEDERRRIVDEWNDTDEDFGRPAVLHELVEQQAARRPDAIGVRDDSRTLTYRGLDREANRVARFLLARGLARESRVGISIDRSVDMIVAILGTLKAGGVFVPLDPDYPRERLAFMIEDASPDVVLTTSDLMDRLPEGTTAVSLDEVRGEIARLSAGPVGLPAHHEQAAYMIYTSGSTGRPKGAINTHAGAANRVLWNQAQAPLRPGDRLLQKTPLNFDVSVNEIFWPLSSGAELVLAKPGGHRDSGYLVDTVRDEAVSVMVFVPSLLSAFIDEPEVRACRSL